MEEKINIAEILKDKKNGLRLYSPIFGECAFCCVRKYTNDICVKKDNGVKEFFDSKGLYYNTGEVMLFPSKSMRDWEKLSWKKGDLLINSCGFQCIFKEWESNDYTKFNGCYSNSRDGYEDVSNAETAKFVKLDNNTAYGYIREIERELGGILNLETLEIEKTHQEFKDGDIVSAVFTDGDEMICVYKEKIEQDYMGYCGFFSKGKHKGDVIMDLGDDCICNDSPICKEIRLATEEEKKQLFSALKNEGKRWDSENKQIVDLKQKWTPKPFDRVITRNDDDDIWTANIFSHMDSHGEYVTIGCVGGYNYCIPYNEENAKLIGTTNNVDG